MPQVTVYIRAEDMDAWKGVVKKSEFIHNALQDRSTYDGAKIVLREDLPPIVDTSPVPPTPAGEPALLPCCLGKTPCKHWLWNGDEQAYINSITGEIRETWTWVGHIVLTENWG